MPLNVYTGLMRSGKSYEVVSEVIVPAIRQGRNVVTNVDGISEEKIHEYLKKKYLEDEHDKYGKIVHVTNGQVFDDKFFPYYDDEKNAHTDTTVQPGDLVAIDEAWRFWGKGMKIKKSHQSFVLEHGHFTHPDTKVACDIVLMIQDMGTLHPFLRNVIAFSFRTNKKVALGLSKVYSLNMWEGKALTKANHIGQWTRKYNPEIFPLYSSFKGGAEGVMVNADKRQNVFRNWKVPAPGNCIQQSSCETERSTSRICATYPRNWASGRRQHRTHPEHQESRRKLLQRLPCPWLRPSHRPG
ncbi:zonular occludens toxin domain-containing protein [Janthinobacterium sp. HLS12-2]|uniref:zonular occludens toxin domain-containing protein n=1 Tax=Janthinobacterium sp. HLS12-2 TaxID=1259324 RepID=UPI003F26FBC1